jgi:hypothetical protein
MTNEQYLIVSYFTAGLISLGLALAAYFWLRRSFREIIRVIPHRYFSRILRKLFLWGIILPALLGFFSVSFRSCSKDTYEKIIAEKAYLVKKNQKQLSNSLFYIIAALAIWGFIIGGSIFIIKKQNNKK